jgi:hypothetical protein
MKNKKGVEMNFSLIFALIVGAVILFLAIYFAITITDSGGEVTSSLAAQELTLRLEPFELGIASGSSEKFEFKDNILLENYCYTDKTFGSQEIILSEKYLSKKDTQRGIPITITNKYVFSNQEEQGETLQVFVKPAEMPFKVSDIIIISGNEYCFEKPPERIKNEINRLNIDNVKILDKDGCEGNEISVCFGDSCSEREIIVKDLCYLTNNACNKDYEYGVVTKNNQELYYYGSLVYGAIFADNQIYNCNVKRLIYRARELAEIYSKQANRARAKKCHTISVVHFTSFLQELQGIEDFSSPILINQIKDLDNANSAAECKLWTRIPE